MRKEHPWDQDSKRDKHSTALQGDQLGCRKGQAGNVAKHLQWLYKSGECNRACNVRMLTLQRDLQRDCRKLEMKGFLLLELG